MSDQIKLNYPAMREMAEHCKKVAGELMNVAQFGRAMGSQLQQTALVGDSGEAFANALNTAFFPAVNKLANKFSEVAKDIEGAISDMQAADKAAGSKF